ncbi:MAG: response regulator [Lentisphaerae bacterium]|nr:response regulator [Lentisphaerota bacterium]
MQLRTTMQLASFFPIFLAALFVVSLFMVHAAHGGPEDDGSAFSAAVATVMGVLSLLGGWVFYRRGQLLVAQLGSLEGMAERVRRGDLTPAEALPHGGGGVSTVAQVFGELVVELDGYVKLIRAHEKLKQELEGAHATAGRLRASAVRVSGALECLHRAEEGILDYLLKEGRYVFTWLPPERLRVGLQDTDVAALSADVARLLRTILIGPIGASAAGGGDAIVDPSPAVVSVEDALSAATDLCQWAWAPRATSVTIVVDCRSDGPFDICVDRLELIQIFAAVFQNGADAMPDGGSITVELSRDTSGSVAVAIADSGVGMSEAVRARCMEPFFSTREKHLGVGLTLAAHLVTKWGARLGVIGEPGQGATVHMTFPALNLEPQPPAKRGTLPPHGSLRILLVDDDDVGREMLTALLVHERHRVTAVEDGATALQALEKQSFDLLLTDRAMPSLTGDELAVTVKASHPEIAVVMVTGMGDAMEREHQHPAGVDVVLTKPVWREDLEQGMARAMACVSGRS